MQSSPFAKGMTTRVNSPWVDLERSVHCYLESLLSTSMPSKR